MDPIEQSGKEKSRRPPIRVTLEQRGAPPTTLRFREPFAIGSDPESDLAIQAPTVSAHHASVVYEDDCWWIRTVEASKGILIDGKQVDAVPLATGTTITLGLSGPTLSFAIGAPEKAERFSRLKLHLPDPIRKVIRASTRIISVEEHKEILRRMIGRVERFQSRKYLRIIVLLSVVGGIAAGYAYYKHTQYDKLAARAQDVFYQMKELELGFSRLESQIRVSGDSSARAEAARYWNRLEDLNTSYDQYVEELGIYSKNMDEKTRVIYRIARVFGECEVNMPKEFVEEVEKYIHEWKLSDRLPNSIQRAQEHGYTSMISRVLVDEHLPPQFMYLALQESGFDSSLCGPPTRFGIAKGMWQFIPSTAQHYGLRTGPLVQLARRDPRDERHQVEKSTVAAARYLRDIYNTEAQASGLLVMASYNWGHNVVKGLIRSLPENPRDRNFWAFLNTYKAKIPKQTYDYVYYIFSAAVIGENPELFGFKFDRPISGHPL